MDKVVIVSTCVVVDALRPTRGDIRCKGVNLCTLGSLNI